MDYKNSLNLPQTEFPMKANLPQREPLTLKQWGDQDVYQKLLLKNKKNPKFILHDGPPYANGHIHFGHILNKILKDIIVKYKNMSGFVSPYVPGWDCHGLPIELGAIKELAEKNKDRASLTPLQKREACRNYAHRFIEDQKKDFKRLGIFGDWDHPYLTLTNQYEADIAREFLGLYTKGFIYQGKKPVYWCVSCQTALAEAEVEYENITSPSIYVAFPLADAFKLEAEEVEDASLVIWTTTPWTLPANVAVAVGEKFEYVLLELEGKHYLLARALKDAFLEAIGFKGEAVERKVFLGSSLAQLKLEYRHPFIKRISPVVLGHHVTLETGTGLVHIAPGHGQEDYEIGQKNKLETLCPVDEAGRFLKDSMAEAVFDEVKQWEGVKVKEANGVIVHFLHEKKILLNAPTQTLNHSFPHCWRCKKPVIFRATKQWFLSLEHSDLRKKALRCINGDVKWIPQWGHDRIFGMIENRPDWCLSRQRVWGVPIIVHHCAQCQTPLLNQKIGDSICSIFEKEGADAWWKDFKPLLPENTVCKCGSREFIKDASILDVWFDSGVSHAAVLERRPELGSPADLYLEGSDQHRGWFHSSLLTSLASRDRAPYKAVLTHGFVVDGQGKKYSKSAKNYVPPEKVLNELGAELLRLWVGAEDYRNDIRVSDEIIKVLAEIYRKIRNTCRFMLGNLYDFNPEKDLVPFEKRTELDRYAMGFLFDTVAKIEKAYQNYEFHGVHHTLNKFFTVELSAVYLDILKDRLYCEKASGFLRRSAQSNLFDILMAVLPLMAPILSFTAEEVWSFLPVSAQKTSSVFFASWPRLGENIKDKNLEARWSRVLTIRDEILKALEETRKKKEIGHSLDAKVVLSAEGETLEFLKEYQDQWSQICITSQVEVVENVSGYQFKSSLVPSLTVSVMPALGKKCERCWNYSLYVGQSPKHPGLCQRCEGVVS
ncbi:MAG: isoleucine--tRNA ligase [Deltaproteobacteria bacterium GWA2_45_12]|nr:MAG: isoleucine--tRNA ligase [Deltaproteobacteria bacterium GWA2_45_12]